MGDEGVFVWGGRIWPWECDDNGHLNVAFHVARGIDGLMSLVAEMGMPRAFAPEAPATVIVRDQHIRFWREAAAGASLSMTGGVLELGECDARLQLIVRHADTGELAATFLLQVEHATAREMRPFPWPRRVLDRAQALNVAPSAQAAPRSIGRGGIDPDNITLERAGALDLTPVGVTPLRMGEVDAFGRMRPEILMNRITGGMMSRERRRLGASAAAPGRLGGAALEYRLIHFAYPRLGDRLDIRGGAAPLGADTRFRKTVSWVLDPDSGRPWGLSARVGVSFDLDSRRIIRPSGEELDDYRALAKPELDI